jgi:ZIP family zinc transporter
LLQKGPVCISGYYPIYSTLALAQAASPLGTAQEHTFSTYVGYMPNGLDGVTVPSNTSAGLPCLGNSSNVDATSYFFAPPPASPPEDDSINTGWDSPNIPAAIVVSIGAGLATAIGGAMVFFPEALKSVPQNLILGISLAVSAGVMIYVSFIEIFAKALDAISSDESFSEGGAVALTTAFFFFGMFCCVLLEMLVTKMTNGGHKHCPAHADLHASVGQSHAAKSKSSSKAYEDPSNVSVSAIAIHNFPEGLATFLATVENISSGAALGVAIAIHNVPEGLCVAMPIYYATGNKWKAFAWSLLSGVTEPIGGIAGYAALQPVFTDVVYGCVFSMVGGMMVFIVCHELLPAAHRYIGDGSKTTAYLVLGMIVMATSLVLFVQ